MITYLVILFFVIWLFLFRFNVYFLKNKAKTKKVITKTNIEKNYTSLLVWTCNVTVALHKNWSFPLSISSVNVIKSAGNCEFGHIYWKILNGKLHFLYSMGLNWVHRTNIKDSIVISLPSSSRISLKRSRLRNKTAFTVYVIYIQYMLCYISSVNSLCYHLI